MTSHAINAQVAPRRIRAFSFSRIAIYTTLILACAVYLVPLLVMLLTSFKTPDDIRSGNLLSIPDVFTVIGWVKAWDGVGGYFWNSVKITIPAVLISTLLGALNGYVLAMWRFRGSQLFFGLLLFGCFLPFQVILLPMSVPIIMVCLIWQFTQIWNDFLFGVVFASGDTQPITVALNNLVNTSTGAKEYNVDMAAAMIAGLPTLLVYILAGKYFLRGLTAGSVKG